MEEPCRIGELPRGGEERRRIGVGRSALSATARRGFQNLCGTRTDGKICEDGVRESKRMENPLKLKRIHHVEFWVGNARQAAYFYRKGFGFSQIAYSGLETGQRQRASYALSQGKANFILTTPMTPDDLAADHIRKHGDGVRDIALEVDDGMRRLPKQSGKELCRPRNRMT